MGNTEALRHQRQNYQPQLPPVLQDIEGACLRANAEAPPTTPLPEHFPSTQGLPHLQVAALEGCSASKAPRVGVVLSGGQAAGGHNVIIGLHDALLRRHGCVNLIGFLGGPSGILDNEVVELNADVIAPYRNQGGFDMIGSGRTKIESPEQFAAAKKTVEALQLDGLVVIGGDDSNTNAALLAEYFKAHNTPCAVVGIPKTIDGDLKTEDVEISFGFDTACRTFSEIIGNIARDALSAKKYTHFIKLMGRSASHIALECALQTHANVTLIGEELARNKATLRDVTKQIADVIAARADAGKNYGIVLIPEGIIEFLPETKLLISELNALLAKESKSFDALATPEDKAAFVVKNLSEEAASCFKAIPQRIQQQLLLDRDPHGNVQVSKIETERLFIASVTEELAKRKKERTFSGKFNAQPHFLGYEGRSALPTNFDANYCYSLGFIAALLVEQEATGYIAAIRNLAGPVDEWQPAAVPLASLIHMETRKGKEKPVIKKAMVELEGPAFKHFATQRNQWEVNDAYTFPGPIQFFGPQDVTDQVPFSLALEQTTPVV